MELANTEESIFHVAIIMDGNGRWAQARGRPREWGHRAGANAVRTIVEACPDRGIDTLTLYAFSSDNWNRPPREVSALLGLFRRYLKSETPSLVEEGVRLRVIGRRDRLPPDLVRAFEAAEEATAEGDRLTLRLAVDYSSREMLTRAVRAAAAQATEATRDGPGAGEAVSPETLATALGRVMHGGGPAADVDLLVRTGGEQRLSDFLLWECAYAELVFTPCMWPDFGVEELEAALQEFRRRDRRFGRVAAAG